MPRSICEIQDSSFLIGLILSSKIMVIEHEIFNLKMINCLLERVFNTKWYEFTCTFKLFSIIHPFNLFLCRDILALGILITELLSR